MKGNFPFYLSQLKAQRYNKNNSIANSAVEIISALDARVKENTGKSISQMSKQELAQIPFDINSKDPQHKKFWGMTGMLNYEEYASFLGFFGKKNREKRKKILKGIGKAYGNIWKTIGKVAATPAVVAILPFKGVIKKKLRKKGITPKKKILQLAEQFYNNIIKSYDYEGYEAHYVDIQNQDKKADALPLALIIPAILKFFQMLMKKKEDNTATPEENEDIAEVENEQKKLDTDPEYKAKVLTENSAEAQSSKTSPIMWVIIAVLAFVVLKKMM